jgi:hypothetical protein
MTFHDRVRARWWASIIMFAVGFAVAELLVWVLMSFVVFVAFSAGGFSLTQELRRLLMIVVQVLIAGVYLWSWAVRGIQLVSVDTILRDSGPLERKVIAARIEQETPGVHVPGLEIAGDAVELQQP